VANVFLSTVGPPASLDATTQRKRTDPLSRPTIKARLDAEVKTWTDQVSDDVLTDAAEAVYGRSKVDRSYDIPYVAGYSIDGRTVFIDRHMPKSMRVRGSAVNIDVFLVLHEMVEKSLLDEMRLHYLHAHQIALRADQAAVRAAGIGWRAYDQFVKANEKHITDERLQRVPINLDLTPYRDEDDFGLLNEMVRKRRRRPS
jgi:hypothetical protein